MPQICNYCKIRSGWKPWRLKQNESESATYEKNEYDVSDVRINISGQEALQTEKQGRWPR